MVAGASTIVAASIAAGTTLILAYGAAMVLTAGASGSDSVVSASIACSDDAAVAVTTIAGAIGSGGTVRDSNSGTDDAATALATIAGAAVIVVTNTSTVLITGVIGFCFVVFGSRKYTLECIKDGAKGLQRSYALFFTTFLVFYFVSSFPAVDAALNIVHCYFNNID